MSPRHSPRSRASDIVVARMFADFSAAGGSLHPRTIDIQGLRIDVHENVAGKLNVSPPPQFGHALTSAAITSELVGDVPADAALDVYTLEPATPIDHVSSIALVIRLPHTARNLAGAPPMHQHKIAASSPK